MLVDSHCHLNCLDLTAYHGDLAKALAAAKKNDVGHFLCVCIDLETFPEVLTIAENYADVSATVGLHPNEPVVNEPTVDHLITLAQHPKIVGIGETGLDYYRTDQQQDWQLQRFRNHIRAAIATQKPLIVHSRMAPEDTIRLLREEKAEQVGGVMHCFVESWEVAKQAMDLNFYISFTGIITFKNAKAIQEVAKQVPLERLLLETDSPYLAPTPFRGKPNQPAYVRYVAEQIALLKQVSYEQVAGISTENYFKLFS